MSRSLNPLVDGLRFIEAPRWRDGWLWFSDMVGRKLCRVSLSGRLEVVAEFDDECSGIDFMPDGSVLVVLRSAKQLLRLDQGAVVVHADLADFPSETLNDMVVDRYGRAYVGAFVGRPQPSTDDRGEAVILLDGSGAVVEVTPSLINPNGMVITAAGEELIVAETRAHRLTSFRIQSDGTLVDRATFADTGTAAPDGICLDAEGAVWVGSPNGNRFFRIARGGEVLDTVETPGAWTIACALGGPNGRTLFLASFASDFATMRSSDTAFSKVETVTVAVPGARRSNDAPSRI